MNPMKTQQEQHLQLSIMTKQSNFSKWLIPVTLAVLLSCSNNQSNMIVGKWKEVSQEIECQDNSTEDRLSRLVKNNGYSSFEFNSEGKSIILNNGTQRVHRFEILADTLTFYFSEEGENRVDMKYHVEVFSPEKVILKTKDVSDGCVLTYVLERQPKDK